MPQAPKKDNQAQKAQDKESKRARGALSCAECRRLKLKCDKTVPCSSCKRRGCSAICPNGSLITGQGTRFVLADTETLHQKIAHMSDRIRQLEDALAILQSTVAGGEPHPLLHRDLLKIKSSIELHSAAGTTGAGNEEHAEGNEEEEGANGDYIDAFGTLAIRDDGAATFYGRSAGSESLLLGEVSTASSIASPPNDRELSPPGQLSSTPSYSDMHSSPQGSPYQVQIQGGYPQRQFNSDGSLPNAVKNFASGFPLAPSVSMDSSSMVSVMSSPSSYAPSSLISRPPPKETVTLQSLVAQYLPPYVEGLRLVQLYLEQAPWFFGAVTRKQLEDELLPLWYEEAAATATSASTPPAGGLIVPTAASGGSSGATTSAVPRTGTSHDLALLFIVFCFGALTDVNLPAPPDNSPAENFYSLTKVALTLDPAAPNGVPDPKSTRNGILERPPSVATVQTLSLMAIYEGMCSGENSIETTWALMGLACKLSQSIGLHRDCARWKLTPAEVQKRRALFWEIFITDCWQSLATGRLATFSLPFVDCELPADPDQTIAEDGSIQPSFPYWKARFGAECVSAVVQGTLTSRAPKYSIILDLDRKVRDMELPGYAQGPPPQGLGLAQTMSHFMPQNYRELTLLYIHRCFFAHAISSNPLDPIKSQYAPSFLAGYRSACTILASVRLQFSMFPAQIARFWVLWTHAFSASVMLASVATHSPRSKIALAALLEIKSACELFEAASAHGGRAVKFLPILKRLQMKAQTSCRNANNGVPSNIPNDIFKPSQINEQKDELSIFSGKTHTMSTKANPSASTSAGAGSPSAAPARSSASSSSRAASDSPKVISDYPSFANVHPSLVSELSVFHGHINTQIEDAYRNGGDFFSSGVPMSVDPGPSRGLQVQMQQRQPPLPPPPPQKQQQQQQQQQQQYLQYQQQQEAMYHQAKMKQEQIDRLEEERLHMERMEQRRQEAERAERERLELERQEMEMEMARQQQEIQRQKNHQYEMQRQQQQQQLQQEAALQREKQQEMLQQQQRQEQYRQQMEAAQQQQQMSHYHPDGTPQHPPYSSVAASQPALPHQHRSHPHHRQPSIEQVYQQQQQYNQQQQHHQAGPQTHAHQRIQNGSQHPIQLQHTPDAAEPVPAPPRQLYTTIPPEYTHHHHQQHHQQQHSSHHTTPEQMHTTTPPNVAYNHNPPNTSSSYAPPPPAVAPPPPPQPAGPPSYVPETYTYWPAASSSFAMPDQRSTAAYTGGQPLYQGYQHHQQYTPENALRGIAAEDQRLQETWQSYMGKVGSPRQFFED